MREAAGSMVDAQLMRAWQIKIRAMTLAALRELYEAFKVRGGDASLYTLYTAEKPLHAVTRPANTLLFAPMLKRAHNGPETVAEVLERWPDDDEIQGAVDGLALALAELGEDPDDW